MSNSPSNDKWVNDFSKALKKKGIEIISTEDAIKRAETLAPNLYWEPFMPALLHELKNSLKLLIFAIIFVFGMQWIYEYFIQIYSEYHLGIIYWITILFVIISSVATYLKKSDKDFKEKDETKTRRGIIDALWNTSKEYERLFGITKSEGLVFYAPKDSRLKDAFVCVGAPNPYSMSIEDKEELILDWDYKITSKFR